MNINKRSKFIRAICLVLAVGMVLTAFMSFVGYLF